MIGGANSDRSPDPGHIPTFHIPSPNNVNSIRVYCQHLKPARAYIGVCSPALPATHHDRPRKRSDVVVATRPRSKLMMCLRFRVLVPCKAITIWGLGTPSCEIIFHIISV